ncbi:MAG: hypothetical protein EPN99_14255 [Frankiales bacterium]|nr:MAG: hypothetical protein EPN99_14255 [Frankiales bacterium]
MVTVSAWTATRLALAGATQCRQLMTKAGQTLSGKRLATAYAFSLCDALTLVSRGAAAGGAFTADAIATGILRSSAEFSPANGFGPALRTGQPYVQGAARDLVWDTACGCLRYGAGNARF